RLTESETAETAKLRGYISSGDAVKRVSDFLGIELESVSVYLNVGRKTGTYYFYTDINSSYVSAGVDALNGDILSLSCYDADNSTKLKNCDFSDAQTARKLIDAAAPNNAKKLEYDMSEVEEYGIMPIAKENSDNVSRASYFCYKVNGIEVMDGGANIRSAAERGGTSYRIAVTRLDEIAAAEYDAPDNFISAGEALKQEDFRLRYVMTEDGARAAYLTDDFRINAITGKRVDYRNEEIKNENGKYAYSDIENHWVKQAAEQLALAGIGFEGGMLLPDETVTAEEAYALLDKQYYNYEKTFKDVKEPLTRNQTAEIITECMGLTELSKSDIFKAPYADATENCGAAAILKGYGIIAADADTFRPNDRITRAEFLQMLYNTLISRH
ncbi:MAG: S-layer homology domain-containing protein, partial [Candidatus Ornithomonoglobus sp.]